MKHLPIINFCYWKAYVHSAYPNGEVGESTFCSGWVAGTLWQGLWERLWCCEL